MGRSASYYGRSLGLSGQEMNALMKQQGYLDGKPGEYSLTEKAAPHAHVKYESRGNGGGWASMNPSWEITTYEPTILDELDLSPAAIAEARRSVSEHRSEQKAAQLARSKPTTPQPAVRVTARSINWSQVFRQAGTTAVFATIDAVANLASTHATRAIDRFITRRYSEQRRNT